MPGPWAVPDPVGPAASAWPTVGAELLRGVAGWEPRVKKALHLPVGHRMGVGGSSNPPPPGLGESLPQLPPTQSVGPWSSRRFASPPWTAGDLLFAWVFLDPWRFAPSVHLALSAAQQPTRTALLQQGASGVHGVVPGTRRTLGSSCRAHALGRPECLGAIGVTRPLGLALRVRQFWGRSGAENGPQSGRARWAADRAQAGRAPGCPIAPLWPKPSTPQHSPAGQATGTHRPAPWHTCPWGGLGPCSVGGGLQALPAQLPHRDRGCAWPRPVGSVPGLGHSHPTCVDRQRAKPLSLCSSPWLGPRAARLWGLPGSPCLTLKGLSLTRSQPARGLVVASPLPTKP